MITLITGAATCMGGIILVLRHIHVWRQKTDESKDASEKNFLFSQMRRRVLTSTCISILGFTIALFHFRDYFTERPISWLILLCCALTLVMMIMFLAAFDLLAVSNAIQIDKKRTGEAARELAKEYHRLKEKAAENDADLRTGRDSEQG